MGPFARIAPRQTPGPPAKRAPCRVSAPLTSARPRNYEARRAQVAEFGRRTGFRYQRCKP